MAAKKGQKDMERVLTKYELSRLLAEKTGFYIHNMATVLDALDEIIVSNMSTATEDNPSEIRLSLGFVFGGRYSPEHEVRDPRTQEKVITPAKFIPYAKFSPAFRKKINKKKSKKLKKIEKARKSDGDKHG